jgi:transketolase
MSRIIKKVLDSDFSIFFVKSENFHTIDPFASETDFNFMGNACRLNALSMIKSAGSGHIGSSFSAIDLIIAIKLFLFDQSIKKTSNDSNIFFTSKGHDAPGVYAVMNAFGEIPDSKMLELRRLNGLPGHPEVGLFGIPTSTGSLGMGISKAKGFCYAFPKSQDKVVVLLGDGELQEGQIWESMPGAARDKLKNLIVIVDGNKIQSDTWVNSTLPLGNLKQRVEGSGWKYLECDGHDFRSLQETFNLIKGSEGPLFLYAHTIKSSGVSFMEEFHETGRFYKFHSGSPTDTEYVRAALELATACSPYLGSELDELKEFDNISEIFQVDHFNPKKRIPSLIELWANLLDELFIKDEKYFALDADLSYDTGTYLVAQKFKDRYIQCGIAEQDMVSMAGTLALSNKIPIVHSFASFLSTRAAEQIFNNLSENSKVIYCGFLAGLLPSAPGHSHQAVSDVGIISSFPNIEILEPACAIELEMSKEYVTTCVKSIYLRVGSVDLPSEYPGPSVQLGDLFQRTNGRDFAIITSGPSMTKIALKVFKQLPEVSVFTFPTIQRKLSNSDTNNLLKFKKIIVLENYLPALALAHSIETSLRSRSYEGKFLRIGPDSIPKNGRADEVLRFHKMDPESIVYTMKKI